MTELLISIYKETFKFLSSVKLAVSLLIGFAILLSYSTIYETLTSTELAQRNIYQTAWFDFLIFLLAMNVLCAALSRLPWKTRHTGFVITHAGILIIILGSTITRKAGVEGQLILQEGEVGEHIMLPDRVLGFSVPRLNITDGKEPWFMDSGLPDGKSVRYEISNTDLECYIEEYYSNPAQREVVTNEGIVENPAVRITIARRGESTLMGEQWLYSDDPLRSSMDMGIASINFSRADSEDELHRLLDASPTTAGINPDVPQGWISLRDEDGNEHHRISMETLRETDHEFDHQGTTYSARLLDYMPRATIQEGNLVNNAHGGINPVARFTIEGLQGAEEHLAFAMFPQFGSIHGERDSFTGLQAVFEFPVQDVQPRSNRFDLVLAPDDSLHYRTQREDGTRTSGSVDFGTPIDTTWNGLEVTVQRFFPRALSSTEIYDQGKDAPPPHNNPVIKARLTDGTNDASVMLPFNNPRTVQVGSESVQMYFGQKQHEMGFAIQLVDFRAPRYPGTNRPARFESDVVFINPDDGTREETRIFMNHPLYHNNLTVYQSSYVEGENGQPDISIFTVAYAPGTNIIYVGSIIMVTGMVLIFASKKYGRRKSFQPRPEAT